MKTSKFFNFLLGVAAISSLFTFSHCGNKDTTTNPVGPSIELQSGTKYITANATVAPGDTIKFKWIVRKGDADLTTFTIKSNNNFLADAVKSGSWNGTSLGKLTSSQSSTYQDEAVFTASLTAGIYNFVLEVADKDGLKATKTINIQVSNPTTPLGSPITGSFYHIAGSLQGAWDLDGNALVSSGGTASTKSMVNTDAAGVAFTGSWSSDQANLTVFSKAASFDYANATVESANNAFSSGFATVSNPAVNDIYIAKKGTTIYVIKITALDPNDNTCGCNNKGKITFEYKKK